MSKNYFSNYVWRYHGDTKDIWDIEIWRYNEDIKVSCLALYLYEGIKIITAIAKIITTF